MLPAIIKQSNVAISFPQEAALIQKNKEVQKQLGFPIYFVKVEEMGRDAESKKILSFSPTTYYFSTHMNSEKNKAENSFYLKGTKTRAQAHAECVKNKDNWTVTKITVDILDSSGKQIIIK